MTEVFKGESMEDYARELEASFRKVREGDVITGTVLSVNEEEAVLDLRYYAPGIIKAEDMSNNPHFVFSEEIKLGDEIEAVVVMADDGEGNIRLSRREAADVLAWDILKQYMEEEKEVSVKVSEVVKAGVVAYLEGIRGFIPASQLSISYVENLEPFMGKELKVRVITLDKEKEKLVMSAKVIEKELAAEDQKSKVSMLAPGTIMEGTVDSLMPYGAFVRLGDGLSGLVHISQISQKRIKAPSEVLKLGDKVKVKILNTNEGKISLSIKALNEDAQTDELEGRDVSEFNSGEEATTSLGALFAKLKL